MKKIFILILLIFVQTGFCNNTLNNTRNNFIGDNAQLIEKLTKDKDFIKFYKLSLAGSLQKFIINENSANKNIVSLKDKELLMNLTEESRVVLGKVYDKFPDFQILDTNQKINVLSSSFEIVATLTFSEVVSCFGPFLGSVANCWSPTKLETAVFIGCMGFAFGADMIVLFETAGAAAAEVTALAGEEVQFCVARAKNYTTAICVVSVVSSLVNCIIINTRD